ncbi:transposable element Tcb1 transposase [Trichonephila clavipes]|nr:transposable element Tcb1 transposase [Trichonephila clavipes]
MSKKKVIFFSNGRQLLESHQPRRRHDWNVDHHSATRLSRIFKSSCYPAGKCCYLLNFWFNVFFIAHPSYTATECHHQALFATIPLDDGNVGESLPSWKYRSPPSYITRLWQRFQDDGNVGESLPQVAPEFEDRYIYIIWQLLPKETDSTASDLSRQLSSATSTTVSRQTMYRRVGHIGLYARRPVRCVLLTATHCHLRLTWSREHALWIPQQWSCVMFSDESRFSLQSDSRRTLIWRAPGTRYHQENTIERHRYGGAGWLPFGEELSLVPPQN